MIPKNRNILITGGFGFIGSNFVNMLIESGHNPPSICIVDNMTYAADYENVPMWSKLGITHIKHSIADKNSVLVDIKRFDPDIIVNFAAESHVDNSLDSAQVFYNSNILGVDVLATWCSDNNVKFVQISTDEVYGDVEIPKDGRLMREFTEEDPLKPSNPYAVSKAAADMLVQSIARSFGLDYLIVRMCNNFGERQFTEKLTPKIIWNAMHGVDIPLYDGGYQIREWLYVGSAVHKIHYLIERWFYNEEVDRSGEIPIFNIGSGLRMTNKDYVEYILQEMTKKRIYNMDCKLKTVSDRPGHDQAYALNCRKLARFHDVSEFGGDFNIFERFMNRTIEYYKDKFLKEKYVT